MIARALAALLALFAAPATAAAQPVGEGEAMYESLRNMALGTRAADLGLAADGRETLVYGIVMDMDVDGATATIVAFGTGDASLYLSHGGGIIGGGAHREVAAAALNFVAAARQHLAGMARTADFPRPGPGAATFYLLTTDGVFAATARQDALGMNAAGLSALFLAGDDLLTALRQMPPPRH